MPSGTTRFGAVCQPALSSTSAIMRSRPAPASRANKASSAAKNGLDTPFDTYQKVSPEMLWGRRWRGVTIVAGSHADGASHGTAARRSKPVPHSPGARQHDHGRHRDEPSELARRRHGSRDRAPSAEEARTKRGGLAPFVDALACRGHPERPHDHTHRGRV